MTFWRPFAAGVATPTSIRRHDIVAFAFKGDPRADACLHFLVGHTLYISFMTLAELDRWAVEHDWGETRRESMREYLKRYAIVPSSRELCLKWAEVTVSAQRSGHRIECADAWIAATALLYNAPLVTHNRRDYLGVPGLTVFSEGS